LNGRFLAELPLKSEFLEPKSFKETFLVQLRPRINSLEKNCFFDLSAVPNTGSSGILLFYEKLITLNLISSACTSASLEPSYVLRAIGADEDLAHSSIRFGIGRFTTEEEVMFFYILTCTLTCYLNVIFIARLIIRLK
jgi:cysteine sulfinate desulfinase/cysteine desulfurase-like protein